MRKGIDPKDIIIDEPDENDPPRLGDQGFELTVGDDLEILLVTHLPDANAFLVSARLQHGDAVSVTPLQNSGWLSAGRPLAPTETAWEIGADIGDRIEFTIERPSEATIHLMLGLWL